jgi:hypothetical protein
MEQVPVSICPANSRALPASSARVAATHALMYQPIPIPLGIARGTATSATAQALAGRMIQDAPVLLAHAHVRVQGPLIIARLVLIPSVPAGTLRVSATSVAILLMRQGLTAAEAASRATGQAVVSILRTGRIIRMNAPGLSEPARDPVVMAPAPVNTLPPAKAVVLLASIVPAPVIRVLMFLLGWIHIMSVRAFLVHAPQIPAAVRAHAVILQRESRAAARASTARGPVLHAQRCSTALIPTVIVPELSAHAPGTYAMEEAHVSILPVSRLAVLARPVAAQATFALM